MINEENEIIDINFEKIDDCTEYFYNEFGKLKTAKAKMDNKRCYRFIRKFLIRQFQENLKFIAKRNKKTMSDNLNALKNIKINKIVKTTIKQAEIDPPKVGQIEAPKQTQD